MPPSKKDLPEAGLGYSAFGIELSGNGSLVAVAPPSDESAQSHQKTCAYDRTRDSSSFNRKTQ
jgi:hypothetical protein